MALSPSTALVTQRPDLDQSFMEFPLASMTEGFIAREAAPVIDVAKQAGNVGRIPVAQLLQTPEINRAPRSDYKRGQFTFTTDTYSTTERGYEEVVDEQEVEMYGSYMAVEMMTALRARRIVLQDYELEVAAALFNTTTFASGQSLSGAGAHQWDSRANATPRDDVTAAKNQVFKNSGFWPNTAIMSAQLFNHLVVTDDLTNLIKYSGKDDPKARNITKAAVAEALNLDRILIAGQAQNTADEGQSATIASIWDPTMCLICRTVEPDNEDYREVCVARTFHWAAAGSTIDGTTESYPDPRVRGEVIRVRTQRQVKVLYVEAGYLLTTLASAGG